MLVSIIGGRLHLLSQVLPKQIFDLLFDFVGTGLEIDSFEVALNTFVFGEGRGGGHDRAFRLEHEVALVDKDLVIGFGWGFLGTRLLVERRLFN